MFRKMDREEIEINKIENLRMVHIYDLSAAAPEDGQKGCTAIAVYFGENQQMNKNETDSHFEMLVNRIFDLYQRDQVGKNVVMDESTRAFLESGAVALHERGLEPFYKMPSDFVPQVPWDSMLSRIFIPLVEYWLKNLYSLFEHPLCFTSREPGWRGAFLLGGDVNLDKKSFYGKVIRMTETTYSIQIRGFEIGEEEGDLLVTVKLERDAMEVSFWSDTLCLRGDGRVEFTATQCRETYAIYHKEEQIYYDTQVYENRAESLGKMLSGYMMAADAEDVKAIYDLPWGMKYILCDREPEQKDVITHIVRGTYIFAGDRCWETRGYATLCHRASHIRLTADGMYLRGVLLGDNRRQISFVKAEGASTEAYKKYLLNHYFICDDALENTMEGQEK